MVLFLKDCTSFRVYCLLYGLLLMFLSVHTIQ
uniref:Uncharacterized protein n=1 Tax=Anguilla anguilla TaxID=7936 RepID=A0A0E9SGJ8_ANGAN